MPATAMTAAVCLIFFLSGAAALLFETLWFRLAALVFGNSVWAASLVLGSFMCGLGLGNSLAARLGPRLRQPLVFYAVLEATIAATGLGLVLALPRSTELVLPLLRPFLDRPAVLNALRLSLSFAMLLVPATAMGATLPVLVKTLSQREPDFGRTLGRLYGWNTLGAAAGALAGELVLIGPLGLRGTGVAAALLDAAAAVVAVTLWRRAGPQPAAETATNAGPEVPGPRPLRLLAAAFLCGAILLALEMVWLRFLALFLVGTSLVFAAMLSVVLLGIGAGGLAASSWLGRDRAAHRWAPGVALLAGSATLLAYITFDRALGLAGSEYTHDPRAIVVESVWLMLSVSFLSGLLFTLLGRAVREDVPDATRAAGLLTLANTTGAMIGAPLAGFVLLPGLGMERSFFALGAAYAAVAALAWTVRPAPSPAERRALWASVAAFSLLAGLFPFGLMNSSYVGRVVRRFATDGSRAIALEEGLTETVIVMRRDVLGQPASHRLVTNGFSMSGTGLVYDRYMKLFVYWPVALHPRLESALLISYGAGTTAQALSDTAGLRSIDVVDISREILSAAPLFFPPPRRTPLQDPRVRVHVEDGRFFLATTTRRFDLITAEPPPPKNAGVVDLYSREYFELVLGRLAPGGVTTHWLPVFLLDPGDTQAIIKAFCSVFEDCSLWSGAGTNWMLAGSRGGLPAVTEEEFGRQWRDPVVGPSLRALALESPEVLGTTFIGDAPFLEELTRHAAPVIDDRPQRISPTSPDEAANLPHYRSIADPAASRRRFETSPWVQRWWPPALRARTLQVFDQAAILDALFTPGAPLAGRLEALHAALSRTPSRTLPLWLMDTQEGEARLATRLAAAGVTGSTVDYYLAADAIARREYAEGARRLEAVLSSDPSSPRVAGLRALALHLAGDAAASRETSAACSPFSLLDPDTCAWLARTFPPAP